MLHAAALVLSLLQVAPAPAPGLTATPTRPLGTLREQAAVQQEWLRYRLDSVLPALMRRHGVQLWVVSMREYNEDPVFWSLVSPTTFFARRRTIYVFFDRSAEQGGRGGGGSSGWRWGAARKAGCTTSTRRGTRSTRRSGAGRSSWARRSGICCAG